MPQPDDDVFEQIDRLERVHRRWRWLALTALLGLLVLMPLTCTSIGFWLYSRSYWEPRHEFEIRRDAQREYEMRLRQERLRREALERELEDLRKKLPPDKGP